MKIVVSLDQSLGKPEEYQALFLSLTIIYLTIIYLNSSMRNVLTEQIRKINFLYGGKRLRNTLVTEFRTTKPYNLLTVGKQYFPLPFTN